MAGKYWFFSDVDRLAMQGQAGAFGPVTGSETTEFRVADLHKAANPANPPRAYAACDGLLRARLDDEGGLTLILKPAQQPPFDFPPVAFFLYKGVAPASLLKGGASWPSIEPSRAATSPLVDRMVKDWAANGNTGDPSSKSLGLHLTAVSAAAAGLDPLRFAEDSPLDNLFYDSDSAYPPRIVNAGEEIGVFAVTRFGLELVLGRIGLPPKIALASKRETIITAPAVPAGTPAADDAAAFASRDAREAILGFVDPCAFWGSFRLTGLSARGTTLGTSLVPGPDIYAQLLKGPAAQTPLFHNRHKAYVDIRNDHGHSLNYYRETGDEIMAEVGPTNALAQLSYYFYHGWPSFTVPGGWLISAAPGDVSASFQLALPAVPGSEPVAYISVGYAIGGTKLTARIGRARFAVGAVQGSGFCATMTLTIPLALLNSTPQIHASYHKLHQFRRGGVASGTPAPNSIAPFFQTETDHLFVVPGAAALPRQPAKTGVRVYGEMLFAPGPGGLGGCVCRPGIARDSNNRYLFLLPVAVVEAADPDLVRPALPTFEESGDPQFRPDLMLASGARLVTRDIQASTGSGTVPVTLLREQAPPIANAALSANFWAIAMAETEYAAAAAATAVVGTITLSLGTATAGSDDYVEAVSTTSHVQPAAQNASMVTRVHAKPFTTLYRDATV
jgi:hypothetical protein